MQREHAATLRAAGAVLRAIMEEAESAGWKATSEPGSPSVRPASYGRLVEAAAAADDALFNVLNTAASYCHDQAARELVRAWHDEPEA